MTCVMYNTKAEFLKQPTSVNAINEVVISTDSDWDVVEKVYCMVETGSGREVYKARQVHSEVNAVIEVPYEHSLATRDANYRIRVYAPDDTTTIFNIVYVENVDFQNETLKFACKARVT